MKRIALENTKTALIVAIICHCLLLMAVFMHIHFAPKHRLPHLVQTKQVEIVKAVTVDQHKVEAEISKLKHQQQRKRAQAQAKSRHLRQQAAAAKRQQQQAKAKLAKLKAEQKAITKRNNEKEKAAQAKLAAIKKQQAAAKQQAQKTLAKQKQEQAKLAKLKKQQAIEQHKIQEQAFKQQADKLLQQQLDQEQQQLASTRQQQLQTEIDKYTMLIKHAIEAKWIVPSSAQHNLSCVVMVRVAPGGMVMDVKLVQSSGNAAMDRLATTAVYKASPLPVPSDADLFATFRELQLTLHPEASVS